MGFDLLSFLERHFHFIIDEYDQDTRYIRVTFFRAFSPYHPDIGTGRRGKEPIRRGKAIVLNLASALAMPHRSTAFAAISRGKKTMYTTRATMAGMVMSFIMARTP